MGTRTFYLHLRIDRNHLQHWAQGGNTDIANQPSRKARRRVPLNKLNISQAGIAPGSISIFSMARARTAKM